MDKKELDKFLHDNLSAEVIAALDARYLNSDEQKQIENPIVSKKQKIADFYKSLDNDEKFLLAMIVPSPRGICSLKDASRLLSSKENSSPDYENILDDRYKEIMSKFNDGMEKVMTGKMTLFGL